MSLTRKLPTLKEIKTHITSGDYGKTEAHAKLKEILHAPQARTFGELFRTLSPNKKIGKLSKKNKHRSEEEQKTEAVEIEACELGELEQVCLPLCTPGPEMVTGPALWRLVDAAKKYEVPFKFFIFPNLNSEKDKQEYETWKKNNDAFLKKNAANIVYIDDLKKDPEWAALKKKYFEDSHDLDSVVDADCKRYIDKHEEVDTKISREHIIDSAVSFLYFHSKTPGKTNALVYPKELSDAMMFLRAIAMSEDNGLNEAGLLQIKYTDGPQGQLTKFVKADKSPKGEKAAKIEKPAAIEIVPDEEKQVADPEALASFSNILFSYALTLTPENFIHFALAYQKVTGPKATEALNEIFQKMSINKFAECFAKADQMKSQCNFNKRTGSEYAQLTTMGMYSPRQYNTLPNQLQRTASEPTLGVRRVRSVSPTHG